MSESSNRFLYFKAVESLDPVAASPPVCLYMEVTNRCNLLCQHCPRTFASVERPATMSFEQFRTIVDQVPDLRQAVLHGIGEPLINKYLPRMIRYLKDRGVYVVINTNATFLYPHIQQQLVDSGIDECRVSLDAADAETYEKVRGLPRFDLVLNNLRDFVSFKKEANAERPRLSLWLVGLKETLPQLDRFVQIAHDLGINEVYLQRLVFFDDHQQGQGMATPGQQLFGVSGCEETAMVERAEALARKLGVMFNASGAVTPEESLFPQDREQGWKLCRRPWTLMYITANGNVLPCCIAPFSERDYDSIVLGNVFERPLAEIWNDHLYRKFRTELQSDEPPHSCRNCGVRWSL